MLLVIGLCSNSTYCIRVNPFNRNPDPLLRVTIWIRYHDINSFFKNSVHNERVDKLSLSTKRLEIQLEHELKQLFSLYIQKASIAKITASSENVNSYFNTIRSVYYNLTRNYKLSKVFFYYANFVETFEKNSMKAAGLVEYAKLLQDEEEQKLKNSDTFEKKKKKMLKRKGNRVTPGFGESMSMSSGSSKRNPSVKYAVSSMNQANGLIGDDISSDKKNAEDSLQNEIDAVDPENEGESAEDSYRTMISSQKSQIPYYLFILGTIVVPITMITIIAVLSVSLSTSLYDLADISFVSILPFLPLQFVKEVRMHNFYPDLMPLSSIELTVKRYGNSFSNMQVDERYWSSIPCTISYPLVTMGNTINPQPSVRFVYKPATLRDLALLIDDDMKKLYASLQNADHSVGSLETNPPFLFIWANAYQLEQLATAFFNEYLDTFDNRIRDFQASFFSVGSAVYVARILVLLTITVIVTMYLFFEKNRILQLFMEIPSELFASAYRELESKSSLSKSANKVYSRSSATGIPIRLLIVLIYVLYLIFELVYLVTTYGIFASNVGDFQRDIGLISHLSKFASATNSANFICNEYFFYQNTSSLLHNSVHYNLTNTNSPITSMPFPSSTQLFEDWNRVTDGDATAYGLYLASTSSSFSLNFFC